MLKFLRITLGTILLLPILAVWYVATIIYTITVLPLGLLIYSPLCLLSGDFKPCQTLFDVIKFMWRCWIDIYIDLIKH